MAYSEYFSSSYHQARDRFRQAIDRVGWELESQQLDIVAEDGRDLSIDVGLYGSGTEAIVVSSGLHGVEGYLGSAIQLAWLQELSATKLAGVRLVFLHALNPYGFACSRRWNEDGVDLNRNFLLAGEEFAGSPADYSKLYNFFNPASPPSQWDTFLLEALGSAVRYGAQNVKQTLMIGQYDYPRGLSFGGHGPTQTQRILRANLQRWLGSAAAITHIDFHTGLGPRATYKLFPKGTVSSADRARLSQKFGAESIEFPEARRLSYPIRGSLGQWCQELSIDRTYNVATVEFGTYPALKVLQAVRAEQQAHWYGLPDRDYSWAKRLLVEMFSPAAPDWQSSCVAQGLKICQQATSDTAG
jgi:predicted deacylase